MPLVPPKPLPQQPHIPLVTIDLESGLVAVPRPWVEYFASADAVLRLVAFANVNAANDAAAAAAGVPVGGFYRNVNALQIRLA